jgi:uncharacterized paraquat-inducible protein A
MTKMSGPAKPTDESPSQSGVACAKCEHINSRGRSVCERCGAHLYVLCHSCGHRNERFHTRCPECGHKLHRSPVKRAVRAFLGKDKKGAQVLLLVLAILIGIALIIWLTNLRLPPA